MQPQTEIDDMRSMLSSIIELLNQSVGDRKAQADKYNDLIVAAAHDRAETINMLVKLSNVVEAITSEYTTHINTLKEHRDKLQKENMDLLDIIKRKDEAIDAERKRYDELLKQLFIIAKQKSTDTNINVR